MQSIRNLDKVPSPALILFPEIIEKNIATMLEIVGGRAELLRPHVKTHKLGEILKLQRERGIDKVNEEQMECKQCNTQLNYILDPNSHDCQVCPPGKWWMPLFHEQNHASYAQQQQYC